MMDVKTKYRNHSKSSSSDDDSGDSDKECNVWKRAVKKSNSEKTLEKVQVEEVSIESVPKAKRKKNTIWSDILQDQLISQDLNSVLLKNKPRDYGDRGEESYDYTLKYADKNYKRDSDTKMSEDEDTEKNSVSSRDANSGKKSVSSYRPFKSSKYVELDSAEKDAVRKINKVIAEKKVHLICRIVKYLGIEKAISLMKMTEDIEENGGMMIANHARRRTPGGVYLQLVRSDKDVSKEILDKIFEGEMGPIELKNHYAKLKEQKKLYKKKKQLLSKLQSAPSQISEVEEMESADSVEMCEKPKEPEKTLISEEPPPPPKPVYPLAPSPEPIVVKNKSDSDIEDGEIDY